MVAMLAAPTPSPPYTGERVGVRGRLSELCNYPHDSRNIVASFIHKCSPIMEKCSASTLLQKVRIIFHKSFTGLE
jgi:hypothetical protein